MAKVMISAVFLLGLLGSVPSPVVMALPTPDEHSGLAIPLFKRASLWLEPGGSADGDNDDADGESGSEFNVTRIVNFTAIKKHVAQVNAKYKQSFLNYKQNTGQLYLVPDGPLDSSSPAQIDDQDDTSPAGAYNNASYAAESSSVNAVEPANATRSRTDNEVDAHPAGAAIGKMASKVPVHANNAASPLLALPDRRRRIRVSTNGEAGLPLTSVDRDLLWVGYVKVGSNDQPFLIDFDTGSADFWIPSVDCSRDDCGKHRRYNPYSSRTSRTASGKKFSISYGDGSSSSGPVYTDSVSVAGITASNQYLSAVTAVSSSFRDETEDGIMGMAFQSISELNESPFFNTLIAQKKVSSPVFSFRLGRKNSELYLGGMNSARYTGPISWYPLISRSYWLITGLPEVNGVPIRGKLYSMAVDTGTTIIIAPPADARVFWSSVPESAPYPSADGYYTFPCYKPPKVTMTFTGSSRPWSISTADFNLGQISRGSSTCVGAIVGLNSGSRAHPWTARSDQLMNSLSEVGVDAWILGDTFLKSTWAQNLDARAIVLATNGTRSQTYTQSSTLDNSESDLPRRFDEVSRIMAKMASLYYED